MYSLLRDHLVGGDLYYLQFYFRALIGSKLVFSVGSHIGLLVCNIALSFLSAKADIAGFECSVNWYYRRIIRLIDEVAEQSKKVLPSNRKIVNSFIQSDWSLFIDDLCNGLQSAATFDSTDWDNNFLFNQFKPYLLKEEQRMEKMLCTVTYNLDDENTLALVTGGGRPEKVSISPTYDAPFDSPMVPVHHASCLSPAQAWTAHRQTCKIHDTPSERIRHHSIFTHDGVQCCFEPNRYLERQVHLRNYESSLTVNP